METGSYARVKKLKMVEAEEDFREVEPWQTPIVVNSYNIPAPETFVMGDDFEVWESQVRCYIKQVPGSMRVDMILGFLAWDSYRKIMLYVSLEDAQQLLQLLRKRLVNFLPKEQYLEQFFLRHQQPNES
ncbi:unnamed protein product [Echinostoma caproni]|uniref:Retrovirus-related Pol polyprotein from transposon TNT 1-94 n=1 Tax=Echinostoma caproni TaxID=27848 RepID=A0A183AXB4_9TREM|nr:unnamed protein product [Echinostoma caproni]